jgi:hypothetical protein
MVLVLAGMSIAAEKGADVSPWGEAVNGVKVRLRAEQPSWAADQTPTLKVDIESEREMTLPVASADTGFLVFVDDKRYGSTLSRAPITGPAKKRDGLDLTLSPHLWGPWDSGKPSLDLKPGKHVVRVGHVLSWPAKEGDKPVLPMSNAVEIEVTPVRFAIYRVIGVKDAREAEGVPLDELKLDPVPDIGADDVVSYDWKEHVVTLKPGVKQRLPKPGLSGMPFVVVVDGKRCYLGAFWSAISSQLPTVPTIEAQMPGVKALPKDAVLIDRTVVKKEGDPDPPDPRADERVRKALDALGKLKKPE